MKIAIYGAYGYQGRLVLAELVRHPVEPVLVGRDADRLAGAAAGLDAETRVARIDDHHGLVAAFRGADAVINCAGPFTPRGNAVALAAIAAGAHYVDTSGEQPQIKHVYDTCDRPAAEAGVVVTPAMTDSGVPGDLLAHLLAENLGSGPLEEVLAVHRTSIDDEPMSRGSMRSLFGIADVLKSGGLAFENGEWRGGVRPRLTSAAFPGESPAPVVPLALQEVISVPRHVQVAHVQGFAEAVLADALSSAIPEEAIGSMPEGPSDAARSRDRWAILVEASTPDGRRARAVAQGPDSYGTTAVIAVEGVLRLGGPAGARAPSEALPPAGFLDALAPYGVTWDIEDVT
jgi:short subunit dehydrogenase-like uncharacterized protein